MISQASLDRIAEALERLAPRGPEPADPLASPAYLWRGGVLRAAREFKPMPLALLAGVDAQKEVLVENSRRLAKGFAAHDALLWGARGAGKSALVKSAVGAIQQEDLPLALIETVADDVESLPDLFTQIADVPRAFIIFIDDLGFADDSPQPRLLRSMLEGGAEARPSNVRFCVTANRRHILSRDMNEQASPINPRDVVDDKLALADRFGLSLGFHMCDQDTFLAMIEGYARHFDLPFNRQEALTWSVQRGSRSGRVAWQYIVDLAGRHDLAI